MNSRSAPCEEQPTPSGREVTSTRSTDRWPSAVRRPVHSLGGKASASRHAVENGWAVLALRAIHNLPLELRQSGP